MIRCLLIVIEFEGFLCQSSEVVGEGWGGGEVRCMLLLMYVSKGSCLLKSLHNFGIIISRYVNSHGRYKYSTG